MRERRFGSVRTGGRPQLTTAVTAHGLGPNGTNMKIMKALQNPFALVAQGFVAGAILFFSTTPAELDPQGAAVQSAAIERSIGA